MAAQPRLTGIPHGHRHRRGFALVVTVSLMVLLAVISVGLLGLSAVAMRSSSLGTAQAEAQANARLALMMAIGELQKELGPDMRVSAEAAVFDRDPDTETVEGVEQPHWLASYESWGSWLNASYENPASGETLTIQDTYTPEREKMFRRWLVSLPEDMSGNVAAPSNLSGWDDGNSVVLVGEGSLGDAARTSPEQVTRAYLQAVGDTGRNAWWIGPENHKARIDLAKQPRSLDAAGWETAHGDTAEVGVGALPGLDALDSDESLSGKLITLPTLRPAGTDAEVVGKHFFDLTATSRGVLASVRTGHLKKDLSLLFEKDKASLPAPYRFNSGDVREPSIRPMSAEIANRPALPGRHFASWTRMRHFYRMYRQDSDAEARTFTSGGTGGSPALRWDGSKPYSDCNAGVFGIDPNDPVPTWRGEDTYIRFPVLTNVTYILSLKTQGSPSNSNLFCVSTPVLVYWNPYNVELRVPNNMLATRSFLPRSQPVIGKLYTGGSSTPEVDRFLDFGGDFYTMTVGSGGFVEFKPGEFRIFTPEPGVFYTGETGRLLPGFDPQSFGGLLYSIATKPESSNPRLAVTFSPVAQSGRLFNSQYGNTPGSFFVPGFWSPVGTNIGGNYLDTLSALHVDWLNTSQAYTPITPDGQPVEWIFNVTRPIAFMQLALKSAYRHTYDTIGWGLDWRCRNWIQAPPFYLGKGLYLSEDNTIANTQRSDCPYEFRFGSLLGKDPGDLLPSFGNNALLSNTERITAVACLELPTAPIASLAGFSGMRIDPGWTRTDAINGEWQIKRAASGRIDTSGNSLHYADAKATSYQSGITGPGIGNSFLHPVIPRTDVYRNFDNSASMEPTNFTDRNTGYNKTDTKAYRDYWDHVLLLNDALWDDYFVSSLADQNRGNQSAGDSLAENLRKLVEGNELSNSRYRPHLAGASPAEIRAELEAGDGYLKAAAYLMVDGMFNVNSTSVDAWHALFAGIRERKVVYRDGSGALRPVSIPSGKRIALSRFNTANTDQEMTEPEFGIDRDDGMKAWSGVRFLDDDQLRKLAEERVKQVKRRGPFLNFSEFINRRLSNDDLGVMGALQSAIDYDDANPESGSINFPFKSERDFRIEAGDLVTNAYATPEAAVGSRYAGIPGYVIQSDLLKPISNTLSVRDDTFRIRAYGDSLDPNGNIVARAWCEAIVQRLPEYSDPGDDPDVPAREMTPGGGFSSIDASALAPANRRFGRKFQIQGFRWLGASEI